MDAKLKNREDASEFIEEAVRRSLARQTRDEDSDRDIEIINRNARQLNEEAEDVLEYQAALRATRSSSSTSPWRERWNCLSSVVRPKARSF